MRVVTGEALTLFEGAVRGCARILLHQVRVTRAAERRTLGLQQVAPIGAVARVARRAISQPYGRMRVGLLEVVLQLRVARVTHLIGPVEEDPGDVRTVRIVTRRALFGLERVVQRGQLLARFGFGAPCGE